MTDSVFDAGLQPERTALAWQRTLLSLVVAFLAASKVLLPLLGVWSYSIAGAGLAVTIGLGVVIERRYRRLHRHLTTVHAGSLPGDGRLVLVCAAITFGCGLLALGFVLGRVL
ncbi:MAG: DUF202 domain-containing protein [Rhodoglobus sp.]